MADDTWTVEREYRALLEAIDHAISVHGKVNANTPLHQRLQRTLGASTLSSPEQT